MHSFFRTGDFPSPGKSQLDYQFPLLPQDGITSSATVHKLTVPPRSKRLSLSFVNTFQVRVGLGFAGAIIWKIGRRREKTYGNQSSWTFLKLNLCQISSPRHIFLWWHLSSQPPRDIISRMERKSVWFFSGSANVSIFHGCPPQMLSALIKALRPHPLKISTATKQFDTHDAFGNISPKRLTFDIYFLYER